MVLACAGLFGTACGSDPGQAILIYDIEPTDAKTTKGEAIRRAVGALRGRIDATKVRGVVKEIPGERVRVILPDLSSEQIAKARELMEDVKADRFRLVYVPTK